MEQSINALRNAFTAFADMRRTHFEAPSAIAGATDPPAIENDLRILREWNTAKQSAALAAYKLAHLWLVLDVPWKCAVFTLEVTSDGGRTRDTNDYIFKRSAEECSGCHGRKLLQLALRKNCR